jgi:hypothetical protein
MSKVIKNVTDLGAAAYYMMHKYKVVGKEGKAVYFEIDTEDESEFDSLYPQYLSSEYHRFDSCLMSLKKLTEYRPREK